MISILDNFFFLLSFITVNIYYHRKQMSFIITLNEIKFKDKNVSKQLSY